MYTRVPEPPDVMRIFVRNRQRYAPGPPSRWITIEVTDFAGTHISHIKEMCKKQMPMAKVDELFYKGQRLADENSIGFYQGRFRLENNAIFETTSNPFWSACMLVCIKDAEQEAAAKPNCRDTQNWTRKTIIHRAAALGVLYNSNNQHQRQPPPLETIDELESFLASHGKKELTMSRFTRLKLEKFHKELMYEYINRMDPIGAFVHAHAVELGFRTDEQDDTVENFMNNNGMFRRRAMNPRGGGASGRGRGRGGGVGGAGPAGGGAIDAGDHGRGRGVNARGGRQARQSNSTGRRNRPVICADCETEIATVYCKDCEQGLALCHECSQRIHQGATRRRHQISDISEAPRVSSYTPKSFKAPFALLVALHYGIQEHPPLLSMTADEVKLRAQVYTDTDLWNKTAGRFFGGFDSMDKTLEKLGFVQKEGAQRSRYALQEAGKPLARKCAQFNEAVDRLYTQHRIPRAPDQYRAVSRAGTVCLLIDRHEPLRDRLLSMAREKNMPAIVRELPVGDFLWIALPANVDIRYYNGDMPHREMVLPHIVERKTWDDLQDSMSTNRFKNQIKNMKSDSFTRDFCSFHHDNCDNLLSYNFANLKSHEAKSARTYLCGPFLQ
ncbi:uncharacterized protein [Ptychodera flava]|uniref:uncharacterized protein n=1 Tax=Ptychodera flava TaxID=63121 RepID=UPI00396A2398